MTMSQNKLPKSEEVKEKVPGVSFRIESVREKAGRTLLVNGEIDNVKVIELTLTAYVRDDAIWKDVKEKLNNFRIYQEDTYKDEIISALSEEVDELNEEKERLRLENETAQAELELKQEKLRRLEHLFSGFEDLLKE